MAKYATNRAGWTPVAHADGAAALANASYHALRTTTASTARIVDIIVTGEAPSTSTVDEIRLRRLSTNATTPTDIAPAPLNPLFASAAVSQSYSAAATGPTIASTSHLVDLGLNAFGGKVRWFAGPDEEIYLSAQTAPNGQVVIDSMSGLGVVSTHMIYEEL